MNQIQLELHRINKYELHMIINDPIYAKLRYKFMFNGISRVDNYNYRVYWEIGNFKKMKVLTKKQIEEYGEIIFNQIELEITQEFIDFMKNDRK